MRLTVGPLPPAVYWRRRVIVLSAVLLALFLVAQACMSASASPENRSSSEPSPTDSPSPSRPVARTTAPAEQPSGKPSGKPSDKPSQKPSQEPTATPVDPNACTDDEMLITAETEQTTFTQGTSVQFTIRIRNDSDRNCRRDIGGDLRELYLRQGTGATKVWSSRDCDAPTGTEVKELTPSFETEYWVVWSGRASDSCNGDNPGGEPVAAGEYELVARLGTAYSDPLPITIQ
jgi:hypothetical protein